MSSDDERLVIEVDDLPEMDVPKRIEIALEDLPPDEPQQQRAYPTVKMLDYPQSSLKAKPSMIRSNMAQSLIAGLIGGFLGWLLITPFYKDTPTFQSVVQMMLTDALFFGTIGAVLGAALGSAEGVVTGVWPKALKNGAIGLGIGLLGGVLGGPVGQILYSMLGGGRGAGLAIQIVDRSLAWGLVGMIVGLGQGVTYRSNKKIVNGLLGGLVGGLLGGVLFDPISMAVGSGAISRMLAITLMGTFTGGAIGLVDEMRKEAWLKIIDGHLKGKEYILFNEVTTIGRDPKCSIVIYKDSQVAPVQAAIRMQGNRHQITDSNTTHGTYVNGRLVANAPLTSGQTIQIGSTVFSFYLRSTAKIA